jgi:hypothetical protein
MRRFRATLYQIEKDGPEGKRWGRSMDVLAAVRGFANYVRMVEPEKGQALAARVQALLEKHGWKPARPRKAAKAAAPPQAPEPEAPKPPERPKKKWWKLW